MDSVTVIGAGLAGCEAAYQIARKGIPVRLIDCKPRTFSPAHKSGAFAELVCSNSLKSDEYGTAGGLLKAELRALKSMVLQEAEIARVPSGGALAVDREIFSERITNVVKSHPLISVECSIVEDWDISSPTVIATGPLTLGGLNKTLYDRTGGSLGFYDAAAPIVSAESIDFEKCFAASRYDKGDADYLNCPLDKEQYREFVRELNFAERAQVHDFDKREIFSGCMPIEIMAQRGEDTIRFGPLKPVGFTDPESGRRPYAVVQLRAENVEKTMYNIVGFQTNLKFGEQKRVFGLIPALKNAEFLRYGVMHRNTYINAPIALDCYSRLKRYPLTFLAGQITGVEGYVESIASGLIAGINIARICKEEEPILLPDTTVIGSLYRYITAPNADFQPMNANFGILPPLETQVRDKKKRKAEYFDRAMRDLKEFQKTNNLI